MSVYDSDQGSIFVEAIQIDVKHYFFLLRSYWWLLLLATLLGAGAAFLYSRSLTPIYRASTTILIDTNMESSQTSLSELNASERLARTYTEIVESTRIRQQVAEIAEIDIEELDDGRIEAEQVRGTELIRIHVENESPVAAATLANAVADVFAAETLSLQTSGFATSKDNLQKQLDYLQEQIDQANATLAALEDEEQAERSRLDGILAQYNQNYTDLLQSFEQIRLTEIESTSNIVQLDPAEVPDTPVRPRMIYNLLLGATLGFIIGITIIFITDYLDDTIKDPAQVERLTHVPIISTLGILDSKTGENGELITKHSPRTPLAESFRDLRTAILFTSVDRPNGIFLVTSAGPSEGKTWVAANLANVFAQAGHRVLLMDADLRRPRVHSIFDLPNKNGLTNLLLKLDLKSESVESGELLKSVLYHIRGYSQPYVITSGPLPPNPSELLGSEKMGSILELLGKAFDYIIIDSPPAMVVTDPFVLSVRSDSVLLVASLGNTRTTQFTKMVTRFRELRVPILGVVMNRTSSRDQNYYNYNYTYENSESTYSDGQETIGQT